MADIKVQQVQEWLLKKYGSRVEFSKFVSSTGFKANGRTDSTTMRALVYALQYEIGIASPNGVFGPQTISLSPTISLSNSSNFSKDIIKILEGGLWCHGYSAGYNEPSVGEGVDFGGKFDLDTENAIKKLQSDIGIVQTGTMRNILWKELLSIKAFTNKWSGGSSRLREAQMYLNSLRINGYDFAQAFIGEYLPTDGLNSRLFSQSIIYYIQANIGLYPSQATGNLGPTTQNNLINVPENLPADTEKSRHFVRAIVFSLLANDYTIVISSYWNQEISNVVSQFQKDMSLDVTGTVNFSTWMALLISYGNKNRAYSVCDTRFEITTSRLSVLKSMGIKAVGRYINGTDFKILRDDEPKRIIDSGLGLIPIYQEAGTSVSNFTYAIGELQAKRALIQLKKFKIPKNAIVYFAVDYDAQDHEITSNIIPYFRGVFNNLEGYEVGIYGTRNVSQRVMSAGYAKTCYVSNMSSGFSGNLGFKMPTNWNFDQFDEITIDDWGIDKVGYSGRFGYVTYLEVGQPSEAQGPYETDVLNDRSAIAINPWNVKRPVFSGTKYDTSASGDFVEDNGIVIGYIYPFQTFSRYKKRNVNGKTALLNRIRYFDHDRKKMSDGYVYLFNRGMSTEHDINPDYYHDYNYDIVTNKFIKTHAQDLDNSKSIEFHVQKSVSYYDNTGKRKGALPVGTKLFLSKGNYDNALDKYDMEFYRDDYKVGKGLETVAYPSFGGQSNPTWMLFDEVQFPGKEKEKFYVSNDISGVKHHPFVDLGLENDARDGSGRSII